MNKIFELTLWMTFSACSGAIAIMLLVNQMFMKNAGYVLGYTVIVLMIIISLLSFSEFNKIWNNTFNKNKEGEE